MDFALACRTCMRSNVVLFKLFDSKLLHGVQLDLALIECTSAQVLENDGLPQQVCTECVEQIQASHKFRLQVLASENEFKELLSQIPLKNEDADSNGVLLPSSFDIKNESKVEDVETYSFEYFNQVTESKIDILDNKPFHCNKCDKKFFDVNKLLIHVVAHNSNLQCLLCKKTCKNKQALEKHIKNKHFIYSNCEECHKEFETDKLFIEHVLTHFPLKQKVQKYEMFPCNQCDQVYDKYRSLAMHMKKHKQSEEKIFICDYCNKQFSRRYTLRRHITIHYKQKSYDCNLCSRTYTKKSNYQKHMQAHEGGMKKVNACPFCDKDFPQLCGLKDHIRTHTGETPFLCSECGRGFKNASNLRQHIMRHAPEKNFQCTVCPKMFVDKLQRNRHLRTHTGAKLYACEECGTTFTTHTALGKHKMIHLGIRPYGCDTCNMTFRAKDHLIRHFRVHTHERPHRCTHCPRTFKQINDLRKHLRVHLGMNTYECSVCHMKFRLKKELKQHYPLHYINGDPPIIRIRKGVELPVLVDKNVIVKDVPIVL